MFLVGVTYAITFCGSTDQAFPSQTGALSRDSSSYRLPKTSWPEKSLLASSTVGQIGQFSNLYGSSSESKQLRNVLAEQVDSKFLTVLDKIVLRVASGGVQLAPPTTPQAIGKALVSNCEAEINSRGISLTRLQKQIAIVRSISVYLVLNARYGFSVNPRDSREELAWSTPERLTSSLPIRTQCMGASNLAQAILSTLGGEYKTNCRYVGGWQRLYSDRPVTWTSNHAWNAIELNGVWIPFDWTSLLQYLEARNGLTSRVVDRWILPLSPEDQELFYARNFGFFRADNETGGSFPDNKERDLSPFHSLMFSSWSYLDVSGLARLERFLLDP